jgi:hypothetical protein
MLGDVAVDRGPEIDEQVEAAARQSAPGECGEEGLGSVPPRAGGWREEGSTRLPGESLRDVRVLPAAVVVKDRVDHVAGRHGRSAVRRKRKNSWCRWRCMRRPITIPSSTLRAADRRLVPSRLPSWVILPALPNLSGSPTGSGRAPGTSDLGDASRSAQWRKIRASATCFARGCARRRSSPTSLDRDQRADMLSLWIQVRASARLREPFVCVSTRGDSV